MLCQQKHSRQIFYCTFLKKLTCSLNFLVPSLISMYKCDCVNGPIFVSFCLINLILFEFYHFRFEMLFRVYNFIMYKITRINFLYFIKLIFYALVCTVCIILIVKKNLFIFGDRIHSNFLWVETRCATL